MGLPIESPLPKTAFIPDAMENGGKTTNGSSKATAGKTPASLDQVEVSVEIEYILIHPKLSPPN